MISLELDNGDVDRLVKAAKTITHASVLEKIKDFRLIGNNTLTFSQKFTKTKDPLFGISVGFETNVQIGFSCDESGRLVVEIVRLADNWAGNYGIQKVIKGFLRASGEKGGLAGFIENKSGGRFVRIADNVVSFAPEPMKVRSVSVREGTLSVKAEVS